MKRFRLPVALAVVAASLVLPASGAAASAKPELCDYVENTICDRLP